MRDVRRVPFSIPFLNLEARSVRLLKIFTFKSLSDSIEVLGVLFGLDTVSKNIKPL